MAATSTAAGTFSENDHYDISSFSYFVYDDLGGAGWAATSTAVGTFFLNMTTLLQVLTHTLYMMIQEEQDGHWAATASCRNIF